MSETASSATVAVVGGGIIGLSLAWRLAQAGFAVTVFDKGTPGTEASWAGAGMLIPGGEIESPSRFSTLALASRRLYPAFVRELETTSGLTIDYQECGALDVAYNDTQWQELQARAQRQSQLGISARQLDLKQITTMWPRLQSQGLLGAFFYPGDAVVNPRELLAALLAVCRLAGVRIRAQAPVTKIAVHEKRVSVCSGDRFDELFSAAVMAAGAWSSTIETENVPPLPAAVPVKGHLIGFAQPDQTCNTVIRHGPTYLFQRANGLLVVGASIEHVGWDRSVDSTITAALAKEAGLLLPHLSETTPTEAWIGFRPGSDDIRLGSWASSRLYLAYGHYRNGILLAPITAAEITHELSASLGMLRRDSASPR